MGCQELQEQYSLGKGCCRLCHDANRYQTMVISGMRHQVCCRVSSEILLRGEPLLDNLSVEELEEEVSMTTALRSKLG